MWIKGRRDHWFATMCVILCDYIIYFCADNACVHECLLQVYLEMRASVRGLACVQWWMIVTCLDSICEYARRSKMQASNVFQSSVIVYCLKLNSYATYVYSRSVHARAHQRRMSKCELHIHAQVYFCPYDSMCIMGVRVFISNIYAWCVREYHRGRYLSSYVRVCRVYLCRVKETLIVIHDVHARMHDTRVFARALKQMVGSG